MEGFLQEKRLEEKAGLFSSGKKYKNRWCVLQGLVFSIYDDFDLKKQKPRGSPKSHFNINGLHCEINEVDGFAHAIVLSPGTREVNQHSIDGLGKGVHEEREIGLTRVFAAEDADIAEAWFNAIQSAYGNSFTSHAQQLEMIDIDNTISHKLTQHELMHAYHKAVVKHQGNEDRLLAIQLAYSNLQRRIDRDENYRKITYQCLLQKTETGGIGLRVAEDEERGEIIVKGVHSEVKINQLGSEAGGSLEEGDVRDFRGQNLSTFIAILMNSMLASY